MKKIFIIFKKELKDTIRDRRTLFFMVVMPFLVIFLLLNLSVRISMSQAKKAEEKVLNVGLVSHGNAEPLRANLLKQKKIKIIESINIDNVDDLIRNQKFDFIMVVDREFDKKITENKTGDIKLYYKTSKENEITKTRIITLINKYRDELLNVRLKDMNLNKSFVTTIHIAEHDIASMKEKIGEYAGGFLPYFLIIFCFMGAMYPAIDLAAGEKERGTIETLLTSPASRGQIVLGKFLVVTLAGLLTAVITLVWLYFTINQLEIPQKILSSLLRIVEVKSIGLFLSLLIPVCVFFAALLLSASVFAKSYKEAQSIIAPLNLIVLIPVFIGIFPGIKLNTTTALIPILNISLASKEIIAGTIKTGLLIEVYLSLIVIAALGLYFCTQWFKREGVIFRGA